MAFLVDAHRRRVPAQNIERSICIGVDMEAAMPTNKDRLAFAALSVNGSAFRTGLRCVCGIDLAQVSAAFFELVGKDGLEAEPALIEDRNRTSCCGVGASLYRKPRTIILRI